MTTYSKDWKEIAYRLKEKVGWRCQKCDHPDDHSAGYGLTVHHINRIKSDNSEKNLAALCQRCHLSFEHAAMRTTQTQLKLF